MNAEIDKRTAAGLRLSCEPAALAGDTASSYPAAASTVDIAHFSVCNILFEVFCGIAVAVVSHCHKSFARRLRCVLHSRNLFNRHCIGLLRKYVKSLFKSVNSDN